MSTHPRLSKLLDQLKNEKGEAYAGRVGAFAHILIGIHQIVGFVHCDVCGPDAALIGNVLVETVSSLALNEGVNRDELKTCFEAVRDDIAEFEERFDSSEKQAKDVLSRVSTNTKH